jgi:hypothetical protein
LPDRGEITERGQHDDRQRVVGDVAAKCCQHLEAIHHRHLEIEEDGVHG